MGRHWDDMASALRHLDIGWIILLDEMAKKDDRSWGAKEDYEQRAQSSLQ